MNRSYMQQSARSALSTADQLSVTTSFVNRVYGWMSGGLTITGITAYLIGTDPAMSQKLAENPGLLWGAMIGELVLVLILSARINKMSAAAATGCYLLFSALTGVVLSFVFVVYSMGSIATTFFTTSLTFGTMSVYGYVTKRDLTSIGNLCFMALIGLIIASVVNIFVGSPALYWLTTYAGILIFVGLTAYDTQKIKEMSIALGSELSASETGKKYAIMGALALYLDFINLFLLLLRIFGGRRD